MRITTGPDFTLREARGEAWQLASRERGILQRIRGLDFLLQHSE